MRQVGAYLRGDDIDLCVGCKPTLREVVESKGQGSRREMARRLKVGEAELDRWLGRKVEPTKRHKELLAKHLGVKVEAVNWEKEN